MNRWFNWHVNCFSCNQVKRYLIYFAVWAISLPLARCVGESGQVIGVEGSEEMVQRATANAKCNSLVQATFFSQDLTKDFSHHSWANQGFDALLIDPPLVHMKLCSMYQILEQKESFMYHVIQLHWQGAGVLVQYGYQLKSSSDGHVYIPNMLNPLHYLKNSRDKRLKHELY